MNTLIVFVPTLLLLGVCLVGLRIAKRQDKAIQTEARRFTDEMRRRK